MVRNNPTSFCLLSCDCLLSALFTLLIFCSFPSSTMSCTISFPVSEKGWTENGKYLPITSEFVLFWDALSQDFPKCYLKLCACSSSDKALFYFLILLMAHFKLRFACLNIIKRCKSFFSPILFWRRYCIILKLFPPWSFARTEGSWHLDKEFLLWEEF